MIAPWWLVWGLLGAMGGTSGVLWYVVVHW